MWRLLTCLLIGCAARAKPVTIRGADLYAHVGELRQAGEAVVPSTKQPVTVRTGEFLVDKSRNQVFVIDQIIANCTGAGIDADPECTLALMRDQKFVVTETPPTVKDQSGDGEDMSALNKARLLTFAIGVPLTIGAFKCEAFDGCKEALAVAAGIDGLLLLLLFTGLK